MSLAALGQDQWETFQERGYLRLGSFLDLGELGDLRAEIDRIMLGTSPPADYRRLTMERDPRDPDGREAGRFSDGFKGPSLNYRRIQGLEHEPLFRRYIEKPLFHDVCERAYGLQKAIAVFRMMLLNKPPFGGVRLGWHQDYWSYLDRQPLVTTWLALDPATVENGCLRVIPQSHALCHLNVDDPSGFLTDSLIARYCRESDVIDLEMDAGDLVLMHNGLLHASHPNRTSQRRRGLSACYIDAASRNLDSNSRYPVVFASAPQEDVS